MVAAWLLIVLLAESSNAFHAAASWAPHRLAPATLVRAKPTMGFTNWLDARSVKFWQSSDTSVSATGGGDAGVAGLTKVANSVDNVAKAGRMLAAVALIDSLHLTSAYAWLYALKLTALVAIVGPLVLPPVLQYLGDIVVSFRRALTPGLLPARYSAPNPNPNPHPHAGAGPGGACLSKAALLPVISHVV